MPVCQVCQKDNPAGVEYCEDCGAALASAGSQPTTSTVAPAGPAPQGGAAPAAPAPSGSASAPSGGSGPVSIPIESPPAPPAGGDGPESSPAPAATEQGARLVGMRFGAPTGEEFPLSAQRLVVGRFDPETGPVDIDLSGSAENAHISRQHGELYREADGRWFVRDLGSTNGVFVKAGSDASFGPRITAPRQLSDGDELAFGNARFLFKSG